MLAPLPPFWPGTSLGQPELKLLAAPRTQRMDLGPSTCLQGAEAQGSTPAPGRERAAGLTHLDFSWCGLLAEAHVHDISCCSVKSR